VQLGPIEVTGVHDVSGHWPADKGFVPPRGWGPYRHFLNAEGNLPLDFGAFLVRGRGRMVLIDAGAGPDHSSLPAGHLLESLASLGVRPDEISDVIFTHLHADHIGWASTSGVVVFPNATYRCHGDDWEYFIGRDQKVSAKLLPIADRFEMWDGAAALFPGLDLLPAPGHTPGSTVIVLSAGERRALLLGDVIHCPAELLEEEWSVLGDVDPKLATRTRDSLARELEGSDTLVAAAHFPGLSFGRLLAADGRRSWLIQRP
jgi:glyoxylase-like metal-dependent hydrolase (beta-lactamase superfamily II)